jgi:hypothetical protein
MATTMNNRSTILASRPMSHRTSDPESVMLYPSQPDPSPRPRQHHSLNAEEALNLDGPAALERRGKGQYKCPYGRECTYGGVKPDSGQLVIFEQNSAFR